MTVSWQWCHVGDSVLNVKASMFIIWLHYVRSVLWCRWNLKIAVSLFRLWVRCAFGKWWSLLLYFTFFLFWGGGVKKMEGWVEVLEWQDDWLCIVQRDWDFYFWHLYSMFKRGKKSRGLVVIAPPFLINHKMLCICRCVHDKKRVTHFERFFPTESLTSELPSYACKQTFRWNPLIPPILNG